MPKWAIDAIAAIAGLAVGAGVVMSMAPAGGAQNCSAELAAAKASRSSLEEQVEAVQGRTASLTDQLAAVEGRSQGWPDGVAENETESGYTQLFDEVASSMDVERLQLDCSEYPCIAVVRFPAGVDGAKAFDKLKGALEDRGFAGHDVMTGGTRLADPFPSGKERDITVFAFVPVEAERPEGLSGRVGHRINGHVKSTVQSIMGGGM